MLFSSQQGKIVKVIFLMVIWIEMTESNSKCDINPGELLTWPMKQTLLKKMKNMLPELL